MSNTRKATRGAASPKSSHGKGRKSIVIVLIVVVALTTFVGAIGMTASSDGASAPESSASASASSPVTEEQYFAAMGSVWENAWVTGTREQNIGICDLLATNPGEFFKRAGLPTDLLPSISAVEYQKRLGAFFDTKCPTVRDAASSSASASPSGQ